jgi:hypothetical protein
MRSVIRGALFGYFLAGVLPSAWVMLVVWAELRKPNPAPDAFSVTIVIPLFLVFAGPFGAAIGAASGAVQNNTGVSNPLSSKSKKPLLVPGANYVTALSLLALEELDRGMAEQVDASRRQELRVAYLREQVDKYRVAWNRTVRAMLYACLLLLVPMFAVIAWGAILVNAALAVWRMRLRVQQTILQWGLEDHPLVDDLPRSLRQGLTVNQH